MKGLNRNLAFTTLVIVCGSSFQFGYNIGVLNQPEVLIIEFYNETYRERYGDVSHSNVDFVFSVTTAIYIIGGMIGSFLGGWLADRVGRIRTVLFSHLFIFIGAALSTACVAAKAPEMLIFGRISVGINAGIGNCIVPIFLSEIAPYSLRGAFGTVHQLLVTFGIFLGSVFGLKEILGTKDRWPYLILLEVIPALTSLLILPWLPETPRYLLLFQRDRDGAASSLKFYRRAEEVDSDMKEMDTEKHESGAAVAPAAAAGGAENRPYTLMQLFKAKHLAPPLRVAVLLQIVQQFSGINAIFFYSSSILRNAKVAEDRVQFAVIGINAVNVAMTVIAVPLMDVAGRRKLLLVPMLGMIVDLILLTICLIVEEHVKGAEPVAYVTVVCVIIYVIGFAVGLGPIPMMIGAELFRQGPRPKAMAVVMFVNWLATFVIALCFEPVQHATHEYVFIIFLILMILFTIYVYFFVPETKNKTFEEIANQFSPGGHLEDGEDG